MTASSVWVPGALLLAPDLAPSAKLLWMLLQSHGSIPAGTALLMADSGLCRQTVLHGLDQIRADGWLGPGAQLSHPSAPGARSAMVPTALLTDRKVGAQGRVLYGILQARFGRTGQFRYRDLGQLADIHHQTAAAAVGDLIRRGWLRTVQTTRLSPVQFDLRNPAAGRTELATARVRQRLDEADHKGEAIMQEYLSLLVDSDNYQDNVNPGFLENPGTGHLLQFDRFYPPDVAFEYNGPQHDGATDLVSAQQSARQQSRDLIKQARCEQEGIRLVVVHACDLSLQGMREKVGGLLPLRDLRGQERLIAFLKRAGRRYQAKAGVPERT